MPSFLPLFMTFPSLGLTHSLSHNLIYCAVWKLYKPQHIPTATLQRLLNFSRRCGKPEVTFSSIPQEWATPACCLWIWNFKLYWARYWSNKNCFRYKSFLVLVCNKSTSESGGSSKKRAKCWTVSIAHTYHHLKWRQSCFIWITLPYTDCGVFLVEWIDKVHGYGCYNTV